MNKRNILIILYIFFICKPTSTIIFESDDLHNVLQYADKDTFFVFDIDDTIAEPSGDIGNSIWLYHNIKKLNKKGIDFDLSLLLMLPLYFLIHTYTDLKTIDNSHKIIAQLQNQNIVAIALTNRSLPIAERTLEQLKKIEINFSSTAPFNKHLELVDTYKGIFTQGIIFSGNNNKGKLLMHFLEKIEYLPKKIFFVDDKLKNIQVVEKEVEAANIEFVGMLFTRRKKMEKLFDPQKAELELHTFLRDHGLAPIEKINLLKPTH